VEETLRILDIYERFAEQDLAVPVIKGIKPSAERFPGAVETWSIEAMMQDRRALQAGTSHFLGQNFSKAQEIRFASASGGEEYCWTTSWGVSTRLIGAVIMTHSDDDGLVLPPRIAPSQVVILPIFRSDDEKATVMAACDDIATGLRRQQWRGEPVRVSIDTRDMRGGEKTWQHVKQGTPLRVEIGPRDIAAEQVSVFRRDRGPKDRENTPTKAFIEGIGGVLEEMQTGLLERARAYRQASTKRLSSLAEVTEFFAEPAKGKGLHGGFAIVQVADDPAVAAALDPLKVTVRCIPTDGPDEPGTCIITGQPTTRPSVLAKAY
jgi:prolyl-tRNA synthetase